MFLSVTSFYIIVSSISLAVFGFVTSTKKSDNNDEIACKDQNGNSVDWFYMYKLPEGYHSRSTNSDNDDGDKINQNGLDFLYLSSNTLKWSLSPLSINDSNSLIGKTIRQAFSNDNKLLLAYNDEPPNAKTDSTLGHTKGLLMTNEFTGFWLIHSVPLFPNFTTNEPEQPNYYYPKSGQMYGQSFLCISINSSQVNLIGKQLMYNEPHVYEFQATDHLKTIFSDVVKVATNKEHIKSPPFWNQQKILSKNGVPFESFAKSRRFGKELYEDWVSPVLNTDLYVETWRHGAGLLPSNCTRINRVWNVSDLNMALINYNFESTKDHSKWSVSSNVEHNWICVGDINRMEHQKNRGGGTVCHSSSQVADAYRLFVDKYEKCS